MGTLQTNLRVALQGGTETKRQLEEIAKGGDAAKAAFERMDAAGKKIPASLQAVDAAAGKVKGNLQGVAQQLGAVGEAANAIGPLGTVAAAGLVGIGALGAGLLVMAKNAISAGDALADSAKKVGIGVEQFQALQFGAKLAGVETGQLEAALKKFGTGVAAAGLGTGALVKTLDVLDPALLKTIQHATSVDEAFTAMATKIAATKDPFEQVQLAVAAFGAKAAEAMLPVILNLEETTRRANELHIIMGGDLVHSADTAQDALDTLGTTVKVNLDAALIALGPTIEGVAIKLANLAAQVGGFFRQVPELEAVENRLSQSRNTREGLQAQGLDTSAVDQGIADLEKRQKILRENATLAAGEAAEKKKQAEIEHNLFLQAAKDAEDRKAADKAAQAEAKKAASEAAAAQKKAESDHKAGLAAVVDLEQKAQTAGLEGVEKLEAERDVAYQKFAELVEKDGLNQEDAARGYLAIWTAADKEITEERKKGEDKRTEIQQRALDKQQREADRAAKRNAEILNQPIEDAARDATRLFGDVLDEFVQTGKVHFGDLWHSFVSIGLHALAEIASQQVLISLGLGSALGLQGGASGNVAGSLLGNTGSTSIWGQLLGVGKDLIGSIFGLTSATETAATAFDVPVSGVAGESTAAGGGAAVSGAALGAAGGILGVLGVAFGTAAAVDAVRRTRRFKFTEEEVFKEANKAALNSEFGSFGKIIGAGHSGAGLFLQNPKVGDRVFADILTIGTAELLRATGLELFKPPTHGTALRAGFEKFIESTGENGANVDFFSGNRFHRGIGQEGTRDILKQRFPADNDGDFVKSMRLFIDEQQEAIGLTDRQLQQFTGLAAVFRSGVGAKAGNEEQRTLAIIADTLGSLAEGGVKAGESMEIVRQAIEALGPPAETFRTLNEFFTSDDNDIAVQDYSDAVQGLAAAYFSDLIPAQTAANLALQQFTEKGVVNFEDLTTAVQAAAQEFQTLKPLLLGLAASVANTPDEFFANGILKPETLADFKEAFATAVRDAVVQGFVEGTLESTFAPVFAPIFAKQTSIIGDLNAGKITPEEAATQLAGVGADLASTLDKLDPIIKQTIDNVHLISDAFGIAGDNAADAAGDIATAFNRSIDRQLLGALDPNLAAQFDLEVTQRDRLKAAREAGADLAKVEELNGLERAALAEQAAQELTRIEEQRTDAIKRVVDQVLQQAERAIDGIKDLVTGLTASPNSPLPPEQAFRAAKDNFDALAAAAAGGDLSAIEKLPQAGQDLLDLAQTLFGSTDQFFAVFNPTLATLKQIAGLDPSAVDLTPDARAQIDAINADADKQIATLNKHHAEAQALFELMLADLDTIVGKGGEAPSDSVTASPGDQVSVPIVGGTAGQFGLSEAESINLQKVLAGAVVGGDIDKDLTAMLATDTFSGKFGPLLSSIFEGATSAHGVHAVLTALQEKIHNPKKVQPVLGFFNEGNFRLSGPDSIPLIPGRVSIAPGETATVTRGNIDEILKQVRDVTARVGVDQIAELRKISTRLAALEARFEAYVGVLQHERHRPVPV